MSVDTTPDGIWSLSALDGVERLDVVRAFRRGETPDFDATARPGDPGMGRSGEEAAAALRDPIYGGSSPQLSQINVPALHKLGLSGKGVVVAILDVGFHWSHEVFRLGRLIARRVTGVR